MSATTSISTGAGDALLALRARAGSTLSGEPRGATLARITAVEGRDGGRFIVHLASDGMTLDDKLFLEREVRDRLPELNVAVNFRRQHGPGPGASAPRPLAPGERRNPFGLTIDRQSIPGVSKVIAVASGKGGVGKSTVSTNLSIALAAAGARVGILDADIYGPSIPLMLGLSGRVPATAGNQLVPLVGHGVKAASFGFLTDPSQPVIWRGPLISKAFRQLCHDVRWGELDYLVIDLPPGTGDVQLAMIEGLELAGVLIVTTPQPVALLDVEKALGMFRALAVPVLGVVENMATYRCPCCGHEDHVFSAGGAAALAERDGLKLLAQLPLDARIRDGGDAGNPAALAGGPAEAVFRELARSVVQGVAMGSAL